MWERISDKAKEFKYGLMVVCMKVGGKTIRPTERDASFTQMETFMMGFGRTIRPMGLEFIHT